MSALDDFDHFCKNRLVFFDRTRVSLSVRCRYDINHVRWNPVVKRNFQDEDVLIDQHIMFIFIALLMKTLCTQPCTVRQSVFEIHLWYLFFFLCLLQTWLNCTIFHPCCRLVPPSLSTVNWVPYSSTPSSFQSISISQICIISGLKGKGSHTLTCQHKFKFHEGPLCLLSKKCYSIKPHPTR